MSGKRWPFCLGLNVLMTNRSTSGQYEHKQGMFEFGQISYQIHIPNEFDITHIL